MELLAGNCAACAFTPVIRERALSSLRGKLAQHTTAGRRQRRRLHGEASHDAATARLNSGAKRANVRPACRAQYEQFFARQHRPQYQRGRRLGGRCSFNRGAASGWRDGATAHGSNSPLAACRHLRLVFLKALQRRRAAGWHSRADLRIIRAARAADGADLRAARLPRSRACCLWCGCGRGGRRGSRRGGRRGGGIGLGGGRRGWGWLCLRFRGSLDRAHGALAGR